MALRIALLVAFASALAGCGGGSSSAPQAGTSASQPVASTCTVFKRGTALSVTFTASDADTACQQWIQERGKQGEFWSRVGQPNEQQSVACVFRNDSGASAEIDDGGGQIYAQNFCAAFAGSQGWTEDTSTEQAVKARAQRAQQRRQQQRQQREATQQAKQQVASDAGTLSTDLQDLHDSAASLGGDSLAGDLSSLRADLNTVLGDLRTVQSDSADVACGDAGVASGDEGSMEGDVSSMEGDISSFESDILLVADAIATLKRDEQTYQRDSNSSGYVSISAPTHAQIVGGIASAQQAISKERAAFASARVTAAQLVAQAKGYVVQANKACK